MSTSMTLNLIRAIPQRPPVTHMHRAEPGQRFAGPMCGQVALDGKSHPRTPHTHDAVRVTCAKCRKALEKRGATA